MAIRSILTSYTGNGGGAAALHMALLMVAKYDARLTAAVSCARIARRHAPRPADRARMARMLPTLESCRQKLRPWQAAFVTEQVRIAFALPRDPSALEPYCGDPSLLVRRAFTDYLPTADNRQSSSG